MQALTAKYIVPKDTHPSFKGRNVLVTGANVGLGFEAAAKFVECGAEKVILGVRTISKGEAAKEQIEQRTGRKGVVEVWHLDMLDYDTIKTFADRVSKELDHLDIAVLNAGCIKIKYTEAQYGFEETMQVNVLSTALLSLLLMPKLKASKTDTFTPVLEIVGSNNHYLVTKLPSETAPFAACNDPNHFMGPQGQYNLSKLFVMYIQSSLLPLANNAKTGKPDVYVTTVCPGPCESDLARDATAWYFKIILSIMKILLQRPTETGARTYISGVTLGEKGHGRFWKDDKIRPYVLSGFEEHRMVLLTILQANRAGGWRACREDARYCLAGDY
jgi:NAD(P)-dependent dehydrogenase (short-subunit alcohol dehydrogenase family)